MLIAEGEVFSFVSVFKVVLLIAATDIKVSDGC